MLNVGLSRKIITPEIGGELFGYGQGVHSTCLNDDLTVTALAVTDGEKKIILLIATVCLTETALTDRIRKEIGDCVNIPANNVILSSTHTHSGPCTYGSVTYGDLDREYCEQIFIPQCKKASIEAMDKLQPAKIGAGTTECFAAINRRQVADNGEILLGQNPDGVFDPTMTVISFSDMNGKPVFNLIHYAAHNTAAGCNTEITRDWSGVMTDAIEKETGVMTSYINGFAGNVGPRLGNGMTTGCLESIYEIGNRAAEDARCAYNSISEYSDADLSVSVGEIKIPYAPKGTVSELRAELESLPKPPITHPIIRMHYCAVKERLGLIENNDPVVSEDYFKFTQTVIKIGPVVLVPSPFECFAQTALDIKRGSVYPYTLCLGTTNGYNSYLPTAEDIPLGGYEINCFNWETQLRFADNAAEKLAAENLRLIEKL